MHSKRPKLSAPSTSTTLRQPLTFHLHSQQILFGDDSTCTEHRSTESMNKREEICTNRGSRVLESDRIMRPMRSKVENKVNKASSHLQESKTTQNNNVCVQNDGKFVDNSLNVAKLQTVRADTKIARSKKNSEKYKANSKCAVNDVDKPLDIVSDDICTEIGSSKTNEIIKNNKECCSQPLQAEHENVSVSGNLYANTISSTMPHSTSQVTPYHASQTHAESVTIKPNSALLVGANAVRVSRLLRDARATIAAPLRPETPLFTTPVSSKKFKLPNNINNSNNVQSHLSWAKHIGIDAPTHHTPHAPLRPSRLSALMSKSSSTSESTEKIATPLNTKEAEHRLLLNLQQAGNNPRRQLQTLQNWLNENNYSFNKHSDNLHSELKEANSSNNDLEKRQNKVCSNHKATNDNRNGKTNNSAFNKELIEYFVECMNKFNDEVQSGAMCTVGKTNDMKKEKINYEIQRDNISIRKESNNGEDWNAHCRLVFTMIALLLRTLEQQRLKEERVWDSVINKLMSLLRCVVYHQETHLVLLETGVVECLMVFAHHQLQEELTSLHTCSWLADFFFILLSITSESNTCVPEWNKEQTEHSCSSYEKCNEESRSVICSTLVTLGIVPLLHSMVTYYLHNYTTNNHNSNFVKANHDESNNMRCVLESKNRDSNSNSINDRRWSNNNNNRKTDKEIISSINNNDDVNEANVDEKLYVMQIISRVCLILRNLASEYGSHLCKLHILELLTELLKCFNVHKLSNCGIIFISKCNFGNNNTTATINSPEQEFINIEHAKQNDLRGALSSQQVLNEVCCFCELQLAVARAFAKLVFDQDCLYHLRCSEFGTEFINVTLSTLQQQCELLTFINDSTDGETVNSETKYSNMENCFEDHRVSYNSSVIRMEVMTMSRLIGIIARVMEGNQEYQDILVLHYTKLIEYLVHTFVNVHHILNDIGDNNDEYYGRQSNIVNNCNNSSTIVQAEKKVEEDVHVSDFVGTSCVVDGNHNNDSSRTIDNGITTLVKKSGQIVESEEFQQIIHHVLWLTGIAAMSVHCPLQEVSSLTSSITNFLNELSRKKSTQQTTIYALMCLSNLSYFFAAMEETLNDNIKENENDIKNSSQIALHCNSSSSSKSNECAESKIVHDAEVSTHNSGDVNGEVRKKTTFQPQVNKTNDVSTQIDCKNINSEEDKLNSNNGVSNNICDKEDWSSVIHVEPVTAVHKPDTTYSLPVIFDKLGYILCAYLLEGEVESSVEATRVLANMSYTLAGREWIEHNKCDELILLFVAHEDTRIAYNCFGIILNLTAASHCRLVSDPVLLKMLLEYTALYTRYTGSRSNDVSCATDESISHTTNKDSINKSVAAAICNDKLDVLTEQTNSSSSSSSASYIVDAAVCSERQQIAELVEKVLQNVHGLLCPSTS